MAIQILPKTSLAQTLGSALGTGLGAGIQGLAQHKLGEIERQRGISQTQAGLQALGAPPGLAYLPENLQPIALKQILQAPNQQAYASALSSLLGGQPATGTAGQVPSGLTAQQTGELARLGLQQQKAQQQQKQFETKEARIEQHAINKETQPYFNEISNSAKAAKENNQRLARMQELINKGNLSNPNFYAITKKIGLDIPAFMSADTQEFNKLSKDFLRSAKAIFGSRLTNLDVNAFLQTVPELAQSDGGKQRIINNMQIFNQGALLRNQAMDQIIAANGGKRPANLSSLVEAAVEPQLDQLAELFAQGTPLGKPVRRAEDAAANQILVNEGTQGIPPQTQEQTASHLGEAGRQLGRTGARIIESIAGIPGDLASAGLGLANFITGGNIPGAEGAQKYIPTSANLRRITQALTGEALEPQSINERISDELFSDFATFAIPIKGKIPFKSAAVKSILGNAAGFLGEKIGGPIGKGLAKVGTVLGLSFGGSRNALNNMMQQSYQNAENLAGAAKENAKDLGKDIKTLTKELTTGIKTPGKEFVSERIRGISDAIKNNKISVKNAWNLKKEVNELIRDPETPRTANKYLGRLGESLSKILSSYGKTNTEFGKAFNQSEDIYRGLNQASDIAKIIQKSVKPESLTSNLLKTVLYGVSFKHPGVLPVAAGALGVGLGIQGITKFTQLLKNSSEARKYYRNILMGAVRENTSLIQRNAKKLDKLATEEGY